MVTLSPTVVEAVLGVFLLAMVPARRWLGARQVKVGSGTLACVGGAIGFLTGMVAATGPINAPFFLAHGLTKGAYLLDGSAGLRRYVYLTKALVFRDAGALPDAALGQGALVGCSLMTGSWIAKRIVQRMTPGDFRFVMEVLLVIAGVMMLVPGGRLSGWLGSAAFTSAFAVGLLVHFLVRPRAGKHSRRSWARLHCGRLPFHRPCERRGQGAFQ
jgi:uncharacterized membrane protein YfcA